MTELLAKAISTTGAFLLALFSAHHIDPQICGAHDKIKYCYYKGDEGSKKVVYFLHGFANNETAWSWNSVTQRIESRWKDTGAQRPHVIAVSFGSFWWYTSQAQGEELRSFARWAEGEFRIPQNPDRAVYGDSMGGHNSLRWAADSPGFFTRVALICPALPASFIEKPVEARGWWLLSRAANGAILDRYTFGSQAFASPLKTVDAQLNTAKSVYIAVSDEDQFGFYDGDMELYRILKANPNREVVLDAQAVHHCNIQAQKLADFLAR